MLTALCPAAVAHLARTTRRWRQAGRMA